MKKLIIISSGFIIVCIIISFGILPNLKDISSADDDEITSSQSITYVVKNFNGSIAVFEYGNDTPFKVTDINVKNLPYDDQNLLSQGIKVKTKEELKLVLEDYCS